MLSWMPFDTGLAGTKRSGQQPTQTPTGIPPRNGPSPRLNVRLLSLRSGIPWPARARSFAAAKASRPRRVTVGRRNSLRPSSAGWRGYGPCLKKHERRWQGTRMRMLRSRRLRASRWSGNRICPPSAHWTSSAPAPRSAAGMTDTVRGGLEALGDHRPRPDRVLNRIPQDVRRRIIDLAPEVPLKFYKTVCPPGL